MSLEAGSAKEALAERFLVLASEMGERANEAATHLDGTRGPAHDHADLALAAKNYAAAALSFVQAHVTAAAPARTRR